MSDATAFEKAIAARDSQSAIRMTTADPQLLTVQVSGGLTPIAAAAYAGAWDLVRWFAELGGIANVTDAIFADDDEAGSLLDLHPDQVNAYTNDGFTPLHVAAYFGRNAAAIDLISRGADVNAVSRNELKNTPLHAAIAGSASEAVVEMIVERGADIHSGDPPALHLAAANGRAETIRFLRERGASSSVRCKDGKTAADLAIEAGHSEVVDLLK